MNSSETHAALSPVSYYQIVSFGDSLSDAGTYAPAAARFGGGRFTTNPGQVWTQVLAQFYGDSLQPAYTSGLSTPLIANPSGFGYAQGGARVENATPFSGNTLLYKQPHSVYSSQSLIEILKNTQEIGAQEAPDNGVDFHLSSLSITEQVHRYLQTHHHFSATQLVLLNGGGNDIMANASAAAIGKMKFPEVIEAIRTTALQYAELIQKIFENGAHNFLVSTIPDLGHTPIGMTDIETSTVLTQLSILFNTTFTHALETRLPTDHTVVFLDAFGFMNDTLATHQKHGFSVGNTGIACKLELLPDYAQSALFCSPALYVEPHADRTYMFADGVHPSTGLHALFAQYAKTQFEARFERRLHLQQNSAAAA